MSSSKPNPVVTFIPGHLYREIGSGADGHVFLCTKAMFAGYNGIWMNSKASVLKNVCMINIDTGGLWANNPKRAAYHDVTLELREEKDELS